MLIIREHDLYSPLSLMALTLLPASSVRYIAADRMSDILYSFSNLAREYTELAVSDMEPLEAPGRLLEWSQFEEAAAVT